MICIICFRFSPEANGSDVELAVIPEKDNQASLLELYFVIFIVTYAL